MALDPRKRQKQIERRNAKRKAKKRALQRREMQPLSVRLSRVAVAPILHCCAADTIWTNGIGAVLFSRLLANGNVAFANFLTDVYCLGVKHVRCGIMPQAVYEADYYEPLIERYTMRKLTPEFARKLVEGAVDYAHKLGLPPHRDYAAAQRLFGDVDASAARETFTYGYDGKPLYVQGPFDTPERIGLILEKLTNAVGKDGFHYLMDAKSKNAVLALAASEYPDMEWEFEDFEYLEYDEDDAVDGGPAADRQVRWAET